MPPYRWQPQPQRPPSQHWPATERKYRDAVVAISNKGRGDGTGTVIATKGGKSLIITCGHLFVGRIGGSMDVAFPSTGRRTRGVLLAVDHNVDLAAVEIDASTATIRVADRAPVPGSAVLQYGMPHGRFNRRQGTVRNYETSIPWPQRDRVTQLILNMAVDDGDSGSAVIAGGRLAGVIVSKPSKDNPFYGQAISYAVRLQDVQAFLRKRCPWWWCAPSKPAPTIPHNPPPPNDDIARIIQELRLLQLQLDALAAKLSKPGPQGIAGKPQGPVGPPGKSADLAAIDAKISKLKAEISEIRETRYHAELLDSNGKVRQRVEFGAGRPLRLKLVPVK